ncbi:hypothetical protein I3843_05G203100 [Carya illinoinensis]|nr:hypothetical protein I3843_05G203100 [Carya illinoinensis]
MSTQNKENRGKQMVNHTSRRMSFVVLMERRNQRIALMKKQQPILGRFWDIDLAILEGWATLLCLNI